ncbi:eliciting plant response-like protein [Flagelloscypha sp. PMI_526]|nr:eliciting plant response-like protein [Flagelloscypha sp. PMI_526]
MHITFSTLVLATLYDAFAVAADKASFDAVYDNKALSLTQVACSDGDYGLITRYHWKTIGDIPDLYVGGASAISGWGSPQCGTCWNLTYVAPATTVASSLSFFAIDHADIGFNLNKAGMDKLTSGRAEELGIIEVRVEKVALAACGIKQ